MNIFIHSYISSPLSYYKDGRKEYEKRLSRYCKMKHTIYKNEKQADKAMEKLKQIPFDAGKDAVIFVTSGFEKSCVDSLGLASYIEEKGVSGVSNLHFYVGFDNQFDRTEDLQNDLTPLSFHPTASSICSLSISNMTIPADLLSLILEEQIYRAYRIIYKEPYHK